MKLVVFLSACCFRIRPYHVGVDAFLIRPPWPKTVRISKERAYFLDWWSFDRKRSSFITATVCSRSNSKLAMSTDKASVESNSATTTTSSTTSKARKLRADVQAFHQFAAATVDLSQPHFTEEEEEEEEGKSGNDVQSGLFSGM